MKPKILHLIKISFKHKELYFFRYTEAVEFHPRPILHEIQKELPEAK